MKKTRLPSDVGEQATIVLRGNFLSGPISCDQRTPPSARPRHIATTLAPAVSIEATKTFSPTTIGVVAPGPGIGAFQATLSVTLHRTGSPVSELLPSKFGPRQCGQSLPKAAAPTRI